MEKGLKGGGALKEKMEGEGPKGKFVFLLPLVSRSRGGRGRRGGGAWPAAFGARWRPRRGGEGRGGRKGSIPLFTSSRDGVWQPGHGGARQPVAMVVAATLRAWEWGERMWPALWRWRARWRAYLKAGRARGEEGAVVVASELEDEL